MHPRAPSAVLAGSVEAASQQGQPPAFLPQGQGAWAALAALQGWPPAPMALQRAGPANPGQRAMGGVEIGALGIFPVPHPAPLAQQPRTQEVPAETPQSRPPRRPKGVGYRGNGEWDMVFFFYPQSPLLQALK